MPATVIAERIGWTQSITVLRDRVRELRPVYLPPDPASRTAYDPGELAQCDLWFPPAGPAGAGQSGSPPVLVCRGYSRWLAGTMIRRREAADLISGQWEVLCQLGAVPRALVWDNEGAVGRLAAGRPSSPRRSRRSAGCWATRCDPEPAPGPGIEGHRRAGQRVPGDVVPARPHLHRPRRTSTPSWASGWPWPTAGSAAPGVRARPTDRRGPGGDGGPAADRRRPAGLARHGPAAA